MNIYGRVELDTEITYYQFNHNVRLLYHDTSKKLFKPIFNLI